MHNPRRSNSTPNTLRSMALAAATIGLSLLVTGCSGNLPSNFGIPVSGAKTLHLAGKVYGGQQPIVGATIQLYTVGTSGLKSASTALIGSTVTSGSGGAFSITGDYSCTNATQVYLTASGGNSGAGTNTAITLAAALGSCATLLANANTTFININEITTVAAAYALAPFASSLTGIGAGGSNPTGLVNAFTNAALLANTATGAAGGANLATGVTVPTTEINTLADILAACVNTTGSSSTQCTSLFSATGASDTFGAALAIAASPGSSSITALTSIIPAGAPFVPYSSTAPNDFTIAVTMSGSSVLSTPYGIAIDGSGDAWVTNESGTTVTVFSPSGSVLATPTATGLYGSQGIAIDKTSSNVWVANTAGNSVIRFSLTSGSVSSTSIYTGNGIATPTAIAIDSAGNAFIANFSGNSVTELSSSGVNQNGSPFTGSSNNIVAPTGIAVGSTGGPVYITSASGSIVKLTNAGVYSSTLTDSALHGPTAVVTGASAQLVATGFTTGSAVGGALGEYTTSGTATANSPVSTSFTFPLGIATDYTNYFVADSASSGGLVEYPYNSNTPISTTAGYGSLNTPVGVAVDPSGSVWTANSGSNTLSVFIGLAGSTQTPLSANVGP